MSVAVIDTY